MTQVCLSFVLFGQAHLLENIAFLEDKGKLLEKKLELERIQHAEVLQNELLKVRSHYPYNYFTDCSIPECGGFKDS
jgi:hypothetical protein